MGGSTIRILVIFALLLVAPFAHSATAAEDPVIIAILDSGIRPTHAAFAPGQVVAWRDFVNGAPAPYDDLGHGTQVASAAAGIAASGITPSLSPGTKLAIGKVLSADNGAAWLDVAEAIRWAVDDVGADVISLSIYSYSAGLTAPVGGWHPSAEEMLDALAYARSRGVLPVVLAGNGNNNAGIPSVSYFHVPGVSEAALIVGGAGSNALPQAPLGTMEAEVTSLYTVTAACPASDTCVGSASGTSFSTPRVAGAAARLIAAARAEGRSIAPDEIEARLKAAARDTPAPPTLEGYGFIGPAETNAAVAALVAGEEPQPDGVNALYVENVQAIGRGVWRNGL